jgi:hypothetical protein
VARNPDADPDRCPAGPLLLAIIHARKTMKDFLLPVANLLWAMKLVTENTSLDLHKLRPYHDARPTFIFTDQDKAFMNGLCMAFNCIM